MNITWWSECSVTTALVSTSQIFTVPSSELVAQRLYCPGWWEKVKPDTLSVCPTNSPTTASKTRLVKLNHYPDNQTVCCWMNRSHLTQWNKTIHRFPNRNARCQYPGNFTQVHFLWTSLSILIYKAMFTSFVGPSTQVEDQSVHRWTWKPFLLNLAIGHKE